MFTDYQIRDLLDKVPSWIQEHREGLFRFESDYKVYVGNLGGASFVVRYNVASEARFVSAPENFYHKRRGFYPYIEVKIKLSKDGSSALSTKLPLSAEPRDFDKRIAKLIDPQETWAAKIRLARKKEVEHTVQALENLL